MHRLGRHSRYPGAYGGSLVGDVSTIAQKIHAVLIDDDVVVWSGTGAEVYFMHARIAPELPAESVVGNYRMGASAADIEDDLAALRNARVSDAMIV